MGNNQFSAIGRVAKMIVSKRNRRKKKAEDGKSGDISYSDKFDSSDTSFDKNEQVYYDDSIVRQKFPTFTTTFLSDVASNDGKVKHWLKEYPVNPVRVGEERRKFIKRNIGNPSLVFAED